MKNHAEGQQNFYELPAFSPHLSAASRMLADFAGARAPDWSESASRGYHLSQDQAGAREKPPGLGQASGANRVSTRGHPYIIPFL